MAYGTREPRPERVLPSGELLISHNCIALLHGLYDRPEGIAKSTTDLVASARPYLRIFGSTISDWNICVRAWQMHPSWISTRKVGTRRFWRIEERGYAILRRAVPARIRAYGPYRGMQEIRETETINRRAKLIDFLWETALVDPSFQPLAQTVIELVRVWSIRNAPGPSMMASLRHRHYRDRVWNWLRNHVLRQGELPTGTRNLAPTSRVRELMLDFDALRKPARW